MIAHVRTAPEIGTHRSTVGPVTDHHQKPSLRDPEPPHDQRTPRNPLQSLRGPGQGFESPTGYKRICGAFSEGGRRAFEGAEIAALEDAQRAANKAARKRLHEQRRAERRAKIQAKIVELKAKLHIDRPVGAGSS
jgi:hypothetical protein